MGKIIAISNQKGGVGKTTTSVNLASSLSYLGKKVLLVDIDHQANATTYMGVNRANLEYTVADLFTNGIDINKIIQKVHSVNVDILPARFELTNIESKLLNHDDKEFILSNALNKIKDNYDFILIDCPPSLGIITINALMASDAVLIPVQCEFLAMDGLTQLLNTIRIIQNKQKHNNKTLTIEGVLLTMLDTRSNIGYEVINEVKTYFKEKVFKTIIPRNVKCSVAPSYGLPVTEFSPRSKGSISYQNLAKEMVANIE
ncbi:ParA family protein [Liberiplasma polymorphum]|uniref:ParA family protein n=1 Tax=Liberiplasma polymorphum TaxID=3374570 RepID=UPI0037735601